MENKDMNVNLTHKTEIEVVSPVKMFLTRLFNVTQTLLTGAFFLGGIGMAITESSPHDKGIAIGIAIVMPIVIAVVRKTLDYILNLGE